MIIYKEIFLPMNCCTSEELKAKDNFFSKRSKNYDKRFQKKGLDKTQHLLIEGMTAVMEQKGQRSFGSVMEVGCGVGGLLLTMLGKGLNYAIGIDASEGMLEKAKENALKMKMEEKIVFHHRDFVDVEPELPATDIIILDKVLCCDADPELLIKRSTGKAKTIYAISFPRDNFLVRLFVKTGILITKIFPVKFTPFYHEPADIKRWIEKADFVLSYARNTFIWQVQVYTRK
jgi:magnesium-protoporphyrin O-methyltransferase